MSIQYKIISTALKLSGYKKLFQLPEAEILQKVKSFNKNRDFHLPKDKKFRYGDEPILDKYHCLTIAISEKRTKKALLFFFGGGLIIGPDDGDVKMAAGLGVRSGRDIWFPYYPLCGEHSVMDCYEMAFATYRRMTEVYGAENIAIIGFSSGAALGIGLCLYNNTLEKPIAMPELIIACSPGGTPTTEEEYAEMLKLNEKDIMTDAHFMKTIEGIMRHGRTDVPNYMLSGACGDFTNLPFIHFYYGTDEVLYAEARPFTDACKKFGVPYALHVGDGMCHCYPMVRFFPEGKRANDEIAAILKA